MKNDLYKKEIEMKSGSPINGIWVELSKKKSPRSYIYLYTIMCVRAKLAIL